MARQILPPLLLTLATCGAACRPDTDPSARRSSADNGSGRSVKRPADHRGYTASVFCLLGQGKAPNIPARGRPGFEARFERDARGAAQTIRCHRSTPAPETARERAGRASSRSGSHGRKGGYRNALFDLDADPEEAIDAAAAHPEEAVRLRRARGIPTRGSPPRRTPCQTAYRPS